jgi:hypothetical protein
MPAARIIESAALFGVLRFDMPDRTLSGGTMKIAAAQLRALSLGFTVLGATALSFSATPGRATSVTEPGVTMGSPAGANPPAGLYFVNLANWGIGVDPLIDRTESAGVEIPLFIWSTGWNFFGASYAAAAGAIFEDIGFHQTSYLRGVYNPFIEPLILSWDLGNGFHVSFGENIYLPINSEVAPNSSVPGVFTSAASFEQRVAVSYLAYDWVLSANGIFGIQTNDAAGVKAPDYANLDVTAAHKFGKWTLGFDGYGAWDLETTGIAEKQARGEAIGVGGLLAYDFGVVNVAVEATHQVVTHGTTNLPRDDTRVWTIVQIPIWTPPAAAAPVVAKY